MMRTKLAALAAAAALVLSGCMSDPGNLPLPGGADLGDDPFTVTIEFNDVLDLVPQSSVRVNDIAVGRVTDIKLKGWTAEVTVKINNDVVLPSDAVATIRQTSLLGEKFVSIAAPEGGGSGRLGNNDRIELASSGRNPEIEEVLGAASLLLNGGGIEKTNTIVKELNKTLGGNEEEVKALLQSTSSFLGQLDANKEAILSSLEQVDRLARNVNSQRGTIESALDELPGALKVLDDQRDDLVEVLKALESLGDTATGVVRASRADTVANLKALEPILRNLTLATDDLAGNVSTLLTYPFPDAILATTAPDGTSDPMNDLLPLNDVTAREYPCNQSDPLGDTPQWCTGDFFNLFINVDLSASQLGGILGVEIPTGLPSSSAAASSDDPAGLIELIEGLAPAQGAGQVPQLGQLPSLDSLLGGGSSGTAPSTQQQPQRSSGGLPSLCSLLGSCRPAAGTLDRSVNDLAHLLLAPEVRR